MQPESSRSTGQTCDDGTTCERSAPRQLTLFAEDFLASHSPVRLEDETTRKTSGQKCTKSLSKSGHALCSLRMSPSGQSTGQHGPSSLSATERRAFVLELMISGQTIRDIAGGYVHTPTTKANYTAPSMQKWPSCRRYVRVFGDGPVSPSDAEFLMGFPVGWTDLDVSETQSSPPSPSGSENES